MLALCSIKLRTYFCEYLFCRARARFDPLLCDTFPASRHANAARGRPARPNPKTIPSSTLAATFATSPACPILKVLTRRTSPAGRRYAANLPRAQSKRAIPQPKENGHALRMRFAARHRHPHRLWLAFPSHPKPMKELRLSLAKQPNRLRPIPRQQKPRPIRNSQTWTHPPRTSRNIRRLNQPLALPEIQLRPFPETSGAESPAKSNPPWPSVKRRMKKIAPAARPN